MAASSWGLNRFERTVFWIALLLAGLLIVARIGSIVFITFLHSTR